MTDHQCDVPLTAQHRNGPPLRTVAAGDTDALVAKLRWFHEDAVADQIDALIAERDSLRARVADLEGGDRCEAICNHDSRCALDAGHDGPHETSDYLTGNVLCSWVEVTD